MALAGMVLAVRTMWAVDGWCGNITVNAIRDPAEGAGAPLRTAGDTFILKGARGSWLVGLGWVYVPKPY